MLTYAFDKMVANGKYKDNPKSIWKHIVETHSSTEDAGRIASAAGGNLLVLNHLIPGALKNAEDALYLEGARKHFSGEVLIAPDQLKI
jgi:ribonuclease BN (tRNA processing enzyme)